MPGIRTNAAAEVLGVSPNTLRSWERRYGYPVPKRTVGNHRNYELMELQTLRDALAQTGNISSAIELARQRQSAPASGGDMLAALESFDEGAADRAIEESLALRPLERTVEELLLPAIDELAADPDREAELEFAARWATGWLHGARRLASAASRPAGHPAARLPARAWTPRRFTPRPSTSPCAAPASASSSSPTSSATSASSAPSAPSTRPRSSSAAPAPRPRARSSWSARSASSASSPRSYGFRASGLIGAAVPSAGEKPSQVTGMLNADLRRRAAQAFA